MAKYALCGKFTTDPQDRDALLDILSAAAGLMAQAAGCQMYIVYRDAADGGAVWVTELWESKEAHDNSLSMAGVRDLIAQAMPLVRGPIEQHPLIPVSGKGL